MRNEQITQTFKKANLKQVKKSPFFKLKITDPVREPSSTRLRLTKSGDITKKLNKQNTKLKQNIAELSQVVGEGNMSATQLFKVSEVCGSKFQKYRQKIKEKEDEINRMNKQMEQFKEWWNAQMQERKLSENTVENNDENKRNIKQINLKQLLSEVKENIKRKHDKEEGTKGQFLNLLSLLNEESKKEQNYNFQSLQQLCKEKDLKIYDFVRDITQMRRQNREMEDRIKMLESKLKENVIEIDQTEEEKSFNEVRVLQTQKQDLIQELKELTRQRELQSDFLKKQLSEYRQKLQMYDIRNKAMQEIQKQYKELKEYKENFHSTEQYKAIAQENKEKSKIINTLTNMASQLQTQIKNILGDLHQKDQELQVIVDELNCTAQQNNELKEENEKLKQQNKVLTKLNQLNNSKRNSESQESHQEDQTLNSQLQYYKNKCRQQESSMHSLKESKENVLKGMVNKINSVYKQVQYLQNKLKDNDIILNNIIKDKYDHIVEKVKELQTRLLQSNQVIEQQYSNIESQDKIDVGQIKIYLRQLQQNIKQMHKSKEQLMSTMEEERSKYNNMQGILIEQIKSLKEFNEIIRNYVYEAYHKIKEQQHPQFIAILQGQFNLRKSQQSQESQHFGMQKNNEIYTQTQEHSLVEEIVNEILTYQQLNKLKQYVKNCRWKQFKQNYQFLASKECFLHLYMEQNQEQIQQYKVVLSQNMQPSELQKVFDETRNHNDIINHIKEIISELSQSNDSVSVKSLQLIEKAKHKFFPIPSELSQILQHNVLKLLNAKSNQQCLSAIQYLFEELKQEQEKYHRKIDEKDKVFKHRAAIINKICKRQRQKQEKQIKKSMIVGYGEASFPGIVPPKKQESSQFLSV